MLRLRTTNKHAAYWKNRKIDWKQAYLSTWNHPHRDLIVRALSTFSWYSLWEVGCGAGANLVAILKTFPNRQLGGSDISADAIAVCEETFKGGKFHVEDARDILLSTKSTDVVLADAVLIYIGPKYIKQAINEMVRVARNHVVLCEYHSTSFWKRIWLRLRDGYYAYDYQKLLEQAGCWDIQKIKIPKGYWGETGNWVEFGYIIIARTNKKK